MLNYLEEGNYDGEMTTNMRRQKLEAVKMAQKAIDSFRRAEHSPEALFEQSGNIEWITKLKWFINLLREEFSIEIGENAPELLSDIDALFHERSVANFSAESLARQKETLLYYDLLWDIVDPKDNTFAPIEDGDYEDWDITINPLVVDGRTIDLSVEGRENEIPMNPPNSTLPSKKLWDLIQELGIQNFFRTNWESCAILPSSHEFIQKIENLFQALGESRKQQLIRALTTSTGFKFDNPLESKNEGVENFIRKVRNLLTIPPEDQEW